MSLSKSRTDIYLEKWSAMAFIALIIDAIGFLFTWIGVNLVNQTFPIVNIIFIFSFIWPLQIAFGTLSAFFAISFMDQFKARIAILIVFVFSIFLLFFTNLSNEFENLGYLSLFKYYDPVTLTMEKFQTFNKWGDTLILMIFKVFLILITIFKLEKKDLIPTFNKEEKTTKGKIRGIPLIFFYMRWLKDKFPCVVEQIQADRLILNFFLIYALCVASFQIFMLSSLDQVKAVISISDNILISAITQGRKLEPTLASFALIEGYGVFNILLGVFSVFMGPRLFTRDLLGQTSDMVMSTGISRERFVLERSFAYSIEMIMITVVMMIGVIIATIYRNGVSLLPFLLIAIISAQSFFWAVGMLGFLFTVVINKARLSISLYSLIYFGLLFLYLTTGINPATRSYLKFFPFSLYDPYRILIVQIVDFITIGSIIISLMIGFFALELILLRISRTELVETYEEKQKL